MSEHHHLPQGTIRKLWPGEAPKFRDHLLRLDKTSRRMRFAHGVSDAFIEDYAARMADMGCIVYGFFDGNELRAAAELKKLGDTWGREAEAAFSVEQPLQEHGIEILVSCEQGVCGTCLTRVLEGECDHRDLYFTDEEKAKHDQFTPCCSRAKSKLLVLDL